MHLADSIPGVSDLPGYGIVGALMAIIVTGSVVIIVALWRALQKEQAKREDLEEMLRADVVPTMRSQAATLDKLLPYLLRDGHQ